MIPSATDAIILHGDPEHAGIRAAVIPILAFSLLASFLLLQFVLGQMGPGVGDFAGILSCLLAFPLGFALTWVGEKILKSRWRSGKQITLTTDTIRYEDQEGQQFAIPLHGANALFWAIRLKYPRGGRERRAPASWYCVGCQLVHEDQRLVLFTFVPPEQVEVLARIAPIHRLQPAEVYDLSLSGRWLQSTTRPEIPTAVIAGPNGRYWLAERNRWRGGLELSLNDFQILLNALRDAGLTQKTP